MRSLLFRLALVLFAATSVAAQSAYWRQYTNAAGDFSVLLAGEPRLSTDVQGTKTIHTVQSLVDSLGYSVMYIKQERDQAVDDASYRAFKDFLMKGNARCSVFSEQSAAPALPGYIGRLYRLHCDEFNTNMTLFGNLHWGKHYSYAVMGMFKTASSDPPEIKKFVDSFSLIDPTK